MPTYYCNPDATGDDDGTTQANAWTTLQRAIDGTDGTKPTAGDTVLLKHGNDSDPTEADEVITSAIDMDGNSGTAGVPVRFIGVNQSWAEQDGIYYVINGNGNAINGIVVSSDHTEVANIKIHSCDVVNGAGFGQRVYVAYSDFCMLRNIWVHDCNGASGTTNGIDLSYMRYVMAYRCKATNNKTDGFKVGSGQYIGCVSAFNVGKGFHCTGNNAPMHGCIAYSNTGNGFHAYYTPVPFLHCVANANSGHGIQLEGEHYSVIVGCRCTNHQGAGKYGIYGETARHIVGVKGTYLGNNTNSGIYGYYLDLGDNTLDGSDTNEAGGGYGGYVNASTYDFNLKATATGRSVAMTLP